MVISVIFIFCFSIIFLEVMGNFQMYLSLHSSMAFITAQRAFYLEVTITIWLLHERCSLLLPDRI